MGIFGFGREGGYSPEEVKGNQNAERRFKSEGKRIDEGNTADTARVVEQQKEYDEIASMGDPSQEVRERLDLVREIAEKQFDKNFVETLKLFLETDIDANDENRMRSYMEKNKAMIKESVMILWNSKNGDIGDLTRRTMKRLSYELPARLERSNQDTRRAA